MLNTHKRGTTRRLPCKMGTQRAWGVTGHGRGHATKKRENAVFFSQQKKQTFQAWPNQRRKSSKHQRAYATKKQKTEDNTQQKKETRGPAVKCSRLRIQDTVQLIVFSPFEARGEGTGFHFCLWCCLPENVFSVCRSERLRVAFFVACHMYRTLCTVCASTSSHKAKGNERENKEKGTALFALRALLLMNVQRGRRESRGPYVPLSGVFLPLFVPLRSCLI